MERRIIKRIIIFNLILSSLITFDICMPGRESKTEELKYFYNALIKTGNGGVTKLRGSTYELRHIVELKNGESYLIRKAPSKDYKEGKKIKIIKSFLFNNVNEIMILDKKWEKIYVGLFYNIEVFLIFIFALIITILNIFNTNKALNLALIAAAMFFGIISFVYMI